MRRPWESELMRHSRIRSSVVCGGLVLLMAVHACRLVATQGLNSERFRNTALRQQARRSPLPARPGDILDVHGRLLATSIRVASVFIDPSAISENSELTDSLAQVLKLDAPKLQKRVQQNQHRQFLWVKRRVSDDELRAVLDLGWPRHWVGFRKELKRCYPQGKLAGHVLGVRDIDGIGRDGIERSFNKLLLGEPGFCILTHDARGKTLTIREHLTQPPKPGTTIVLTIDSVVQTFVEQVLEGVMDEWKPESATAIVMDPHTGELLAMANRPTFDLSARGAGGPDAWVNRAISHSYEPGSTFKTFVMAAALDWGLVQPGEMIDCHYGVYRMGRRLLRSDHPHGELSVEQVLIRSDNIGMAIIGQRLSNRGLFRVTEWFGFGRPTGIELPGETPGLVRPLGQWTEYSTGSIPMGQELAVTPIQLITAFCAIANGGKLVRPRIVRALVGPDGRTLAEYPKPDVVRRPVSPETAQFLVDPVLRGVVDDPHGTGRRGKLDGFSVFGKTGTAQLSGGNGGYLSNRHVSSFLAGAPASNPRVAVLLLVNDPSVGSNHYGGRVAAPGVAQILRDTLRYLHVPPDRPINQLAFRK